MSDVSLNNDQVIFLLRADDELYTQLTTECDFHGRRLINFENDDDMFDAWDEQKYNAVAIISKSDVLGKYGLNLVDALNSKRKPHIPILLIGKHLDKNVRKIALSAGITDFFLRPINLKNLETRTNFLIENWGDLQNKLKNQSVGNYKTPFGKRAFDIFFSGLALLCLSPVFLTVYIWIKLESKGPAFYYSYRVGTGYKVFKFYKFRSMYVNADKRLKDLKHLNQYDIDAGTADTDKKDNNTSILCNDCLSYGKCQFPLYADKVKWCEKQFIDSRKTNSGSAFFKIKDDPRITKIGNVIRNLSIDELPQLWNVFIGNMSIVGNRPLPLYEAEKLTTDKYALRFAAPAGITGLWQVEKRGKGDMSEDERLMLDNVYAQNHSLANDLKLIFKTIPALLQKENV